MKGSMCRVFGGAEYLLLRAHFSEAIGFVQVTDSLRDGLPYEHSQAQELNFRYNSAFRTFVGYHLIVSRSPSNSCMAETFPINAI